MDLTLYNPDFDPERKYARTIVDLVGKIAKGHVNA